MIAKKQIWLMSVLKENLYPRESQPGIMYGLSKIHKPLIRNFPNCVLYFQLLIQLPIPTLFVPLLKCFTMNGYTFKDSFEFAKDIINQSSNCLTASLDVNSLFTHVPFDETIEICIDEFFKSGKKMFEML